MQSPGLDVCLSTDILARYSVKDKVVVVIDVLRATSTIATALASGYTAVKPVASLDDCLAEAGPNTVLAAERGGAVPDGFDQGNSPLAYAMAPSPGTRLVLTTTNGTRGILASAAAHVVTTGAFVNLGATLKLIKEEQRDTLLLCAGWNGRANLEDTLLAGALATLLGKRFHWEDDSVLLAAMLYEQWADDIPGLLKKSNHYRRLHRLGADEDIAYCAKIDAAPVAPILQKDCLILR